MIIMSSTPCLLMPVYVFDFYLCQDRNAAIGENASATFEKIAVSVMAFDIFIVTLYSACLSKKAENITNLESISALP